ncbi:hypothetical protein SAMN04489747_3704 [Auraticoccus monumenti]|uniref:Uncharacterized protein n=2 Tax=Auraticoccus monumenti TaxID=675864 RepID=A0A1G7DTC7_9ACTN|nr:hypothetical protein SAMN04489747_3704 [Auraticoccus monumenti]
MRVVIVDAMDSLTIDCDTCAVRGPACDGCVITVLMGRPETAPVVLDDAERQALTALAGSGLLPPLRLVAPVCDPGHLDTA